MMKKRYKLICSAAAAAFSVSPVLGDARTWNSGGGADNSWLNSNNWESAVLPGAGDYAVVSSPDYGVTFPGGTNENFNCLNLYSGTMTISNGLFQADNTSPWDSQIGKTSGELATMNQVGGTARYVFLEIGRDNYSQGEYLLSGGTFLQTGYSRNSGYGLFLGRNDSAAPTGSTGLFEVSGGSVITRYGVMLGDSDETDGVGTFSVQGSGAAEISIGGYTNNVTSSGAWYQYARNTLQLGIDAGGITPIDVTGGDIYFAYGSTVDVSFVEGSTETTGRWTVMTTDGAINNDGLLMAPGVDTNLWNFGVTNGNELWISYGMGAWSAPTVPPPTTGTYAWPTSPSEVTLGWDENATASSYNINRSTESGGPYETIANVSDLSYVDTTVVSNTTYYYTVSGVNDFGEGLESDEYKAVVIPYTIIGTDDVWDESDPTLYKYSLFDDDIDTYFDGTGASAWAGLDFGTAKQVVEVRYVLRNDANSWKGNINAEIQGASDENFTDAVTLYTLGSNSVTYSEVNTVTITNSGSYRYVRLTAGDRNAVNYMSELDFILTSDFTSNGTPNYWLEDYELVTGDDYEAADITDSDDDGLLAWEEYVAGTDPTDDTSVLEINSISNTADGLVITWQSVSNKTYSIITNTSLSVSDSGTAVSGIEATSNVTSYTVSGGSAGSVFYEVGVE